MQDNRTSPRYVKHLRAVIVAEENGQRMTLKGKTQDISAGGASFVSEYNLSFGTTVSFYLMVDPGDATHPPTIFEAQSKIASSVLAPQQGGFRLGLQFIKMSSDSRQLLQKFMTPGTSHK